MRNVPRPANEGKKLLARNTEDVTALITHTPCNNESQGDKRVVRGMPRERGKEGRKANEANKLDRWLTEKPGV